MSTQGTDVKNGRESIKIRAFAGGLLFYDNDKNEVLRLPPEGKEPEIILATQADKQQCRLDDGQWAALMRVLNPPVALVMRIAENRSDEIGQFNAPAKVLNNLCAAGNRSNSTTSPPR